MIPWLWQSFFMTLSRIPSSKRGVRSYSQALNCSSLSVARGIEIDPTAATAAAPQCRAVAAVQLCIHYWAAAAATFRRRTIR